MCVQIARLQYERRHDLGVSQKARFEGFMRGLGSDKLVVEPIQGLGN